MELVMEVCGLLQVTACELHMGTGFTLAYC